jgi:YD repeat-containing protein
VRLLPPLYSPPRTLIESTTFLEPFSASMAHSLQTYRALSVKCPRKAYDCAGRPLTEQNTPEGDYRYEYDQNGNLTHTLDPMNRSITRTYNTANKVTAVTIDGAQPDTIASLSYSYDDNLNYSSVSNNGGTLLQLRCLQPPPQPHIERLRDRRRPPELQPDLLL